MIGKFSHVAERPLQIKKRPAFELPPVKQTGK